MQCGIKLRHVFCLLLPPVIQQLNKSAVCVGMVYLVSDMLRNMAHICVVKLQYKNRWLLVSPVFPYSEHQEIMLHFFRTSCVKNAF